MKRLLIIPIFFGANILYATPARLVDGKIEFSQHNPVTQTMDTFTPENYEVNLSTCISNFENYSDWISCKTKQGLKRKIKQMRAEFDSMSDLPASERLDLRERLSWLKNYYLSLP